MGDRKVPRSQGADRLVRCSLALGVDEDLVLAAWLRWGVLKLLIVESAGDATGCRMSSSELISPNIQGRRCYGMTIVHAFIFGCSLSSGEILP